MLAYLAFKALGGRYPDGLFSAYKRALWQVDPKLQLPVLEAKKGTFDAGHGVYAATVVEAQGYAEEYQAAVYLVAPLPGKHAVVGERGWRAEAAVCLKPLTKENQAQVARLIVDAAAKGLPQIPAILIWAITVASQAEGRLICPSKVNLLDLLQNSKEMRWEEGKHLVSLLPYLERTEDKLAIVQRVAAIPHARIMLDPPMLHRVTLALSEASGKLVMPIGVQLADLLKYCDDDAGAAWLVRMSCLLNDEQFSHACEILLSTSKMEMLAEARRVWLERAALPSNIAEGEMNHRRAWEVLALVKAHGVSRCPQKLLIAAFDFAARRGDFGWVDQLRLYCDDGQWKAVCRTLQDAGRELSLPFSRWATLVLSEASGKLVTPKGVQIEKLLDCKDDKGYATWLGRMARYLSAEQLSYACDILLGASKKELLAEARQVWLERAALPSNIAEGEMNHRRAWEVLALVKAHGVSGCPQELLKAAFEFAVRRGDLDWVVQLSSYCNSEQWEAFRRTLPSTYNLSSLYLAGYAWPKERYVDRYLGLGA